MFMKNILLTAALSLSLWRKIEMTTGIYLLNFEDLVYVGQSMNIERRFRHHKTSFIDGSCNYKMKQAYEKYGIPTLTILYECKEKDLDHLEKQTIIEFDSINAGLNIIDGNTPGGSGYSATKSKYTREQILEIFTLLVEGNTRPEVATILNIPQGSIGNIQCGTSHLWLKEEFPEDYDIMRGYAIYRHLSAKCNTAEAKGQKYPPIVSPEGIVHKDITNIAEFARVHKLDRPAISRVMRGKYPVHKGWRLYNGS